MSMKLKSHSSCRKTIAASGAVWLARWAGSAGDPSLRLKNGSALDDGAATSLRERWKLVSGAADAAPETATGEARHPKSTPFGRC